MKKYFTSSIGLLRVVALFEGLTLLVLVFVAVPMKYLMENHSVSKSFGPIHGVLFIIDVILTLIVGKKHKWSLKTLTIVNLASFIPFGTFVADHKYFKPIFEQK